MRSSAVLLAFAASIVSAASSNSSCTSYSTLPGTATITNLITSTYCPSCDAAKATNGVYVTTYETIYASVCPTGITSVTYLVTQTCTGTTAINPATCPPGFTTVAKVCTACPGAPTLTITQPCVECANNHAATPVVAAPGAPGIAPPAAVTPGAPGYAPPAAVAPGAPGYAPPAAVAPGAPGYAPPAAVAPGAPGYAPAATTPSAPGGYGNALPAAETLGAPGNAPPTVEAPSTPAEGVTPGRPGTTITVMPPQYTGAASMLIMNGLLAAAGVGFTSFGMLLL